MSQLGVGYMINRLFGNQASASDAQEAIGKTIAGLVMGSHDGEDALIFTFTDGTKMALWDDARSCCEHRYLHTDDDLTSVFGAKLMSLEVREGGEKEEYYETHEWAFLHIITDKVTIVVETHNEHNGYYGGIDPRCEFVAS